MPRVHETFIYILSVQVFSVLTWSDLHLPPYISYILYLYLIIYTVLCLFILSNFIDLFMLRSNIVFMYIFWLSIVINRGKEGTEAYVDKFGFKEVCSPNNKLWLISFLINNPFYRILQIFSCPEKIFFITFKHEMNLITLNERHFCSDTDMLWLHSPGRKIKANRKLWYWESQISCPIHFYSVYY